MANNKTYVKLTYEEWYGVVSIAIQKLTYGLLEADDLEADWQTMYSDDMNAAEAAKQAMLDEGWEDV